MKLSPNIADTLADRTTDFQSRAIRVKAACVRALLKRQLEIEVTSADALDLALRFELHEVCASVARKMDSHPNLPEQQRVRVAVVECKLKESSVTTIVEMRSKTYQVSDANKRGAAANLDESR